MFGGGGKPETASTTGAAADGQIDVRRFLGPDYCPELRIPQGKEVVRRYEEGHQDDPGYVIWQASVGKTARECLYDPQGGLTLRVGVSGRVISGPKGGQGAVSVPLKIAVVKYQEAVLASEIYELAVTIPPQGSAVFTEVKEIFVPSPGRDRDYLLYVGFNVTDWDPLHPVEVAAPVVEEPEEEPLPEPQAPPPPREPATPQELPTPKGIIPGM
jgi:hypothetical protein